MRLESKRTLPRAKNSPLDCFCTSARTGAALSSPLAYKKFQTPQWGIWNFGTPEGTRTPDLLIRSQSLYPTELPAHRRFLKAPKYISTTPGKMQALFLKSGRFFRFFPLNLHNGQNATGDDQPIHPDQDPQPPGKLGRCRVLCRRRLGRRLGRWLLGCLPR